MSNTRVVRQGKHHRQAYILFEGRRYYSEELSNVVGHKLRIYSYLGTCQVIKAIRPEGEGAFQLHTKRSAAKKMTNDPVDEYLRYLEEKHLTGRQASITPVNLRRRRQ